MQAFNLVSKMGILALGASGLLLAVSGTAQAATGVAVGAVFLGTDVQCAAPSFNFPVTGTNTINDDGFGNDFVAVIVYDAGFNVLDVDPISLPVGGTANISYTLTGGLTARPIRVRVHDTTGSVPDTNPGVTTALAAPLLAELEVDPGLYDPACAAATMGPEIRIGSTHSAANLVIAGTAPTLVDSLDIVTPADAQLVVTYSAECAVDGPMTSFLGIRIAIDGVTVAPTGPGYALCAGGGTGMTDPWFSGRILGVAEVVPAGGHSIEVFGDGSTSVSEWWLGNRSLSVMVPEPGLAGMIATGVLGLAGLRRRRRPRVGHFGVFGFVAAVGLELIGSPSVGLAQTLIDAKTNGTPQVLTDATPTTLELDASGSLRVAYTPSRFERVQITVTGECQVVSTTDTTTFVGIEVLVNGVVIAPTNTGDAFCTSEGPGSGRWVGSSVTAVTDVVETDVVQSVQVRVRLQGWTAPEFARIDDLSVVVVRTPNPPVAVF